MRALAGKDAEAWAKALRGREDRLAVAGHRSAISRLLGAGGVWPAGPALARKIGADLVAVKAVPEVYCSPRSGSACALAAPAGSRRTRRVGADPPASVAVRTGRPGPGGPDRAALAASLLEGEWRAARAGAQVLNSLGRQAAR